jgi:hypothetical protein
MIGKNSKLLHPYSAGFLIIMDNIFWGVNAITLGLSIPITSAIAFLITGIVVFLIQKYLGKESIGKSFAKAFCVGALACIPTSIAGTALGTAVLIMARSTRLLGKNKKSNRGTANK